MSDGGTVQSRLDTQTGCDGLAPFDGLIRPSSDTQAAIDEATEHDGVGQGNNATHVPRAGTIAEIIEQHRQRQDLHRAEKSLTLQIKAKCRRLCDGDKAEAERLYKAMAGNGEHRMAAVALMANQPFLEARSTIEGSRKAVEKRLDKLAQGLPVADWVKGVKGLGMGGLAAVIGEAGDLSNYPNPGKLWKRLGLAVIQGERQQKKSGPDAIEHGYSPSRRSIVWNWGDAMLRAKGDYQPVYLERMGVEVEKARAEGLVVATSAKETVESWVKRGLPEPTKVPRLDLKKHRSCGHIHNRAKRYMEKRIIRDLWRAWRDSSKCL
jgi:hypothetical protein